MEKKEHSSSARAYICTTRYGAMREIPRCFRNYVHIINKRFRHTWWYTEYIECIISTLRERWKRVLRPSRLEICVATMWTERDGAIIARNTLLNNLPKLMYNLRPYRLTLKFWYRVKCTYVSLDQNSIKVMEN